MTHQRIPGEAIPQTVTPEAARRIVVLIGTGRSGTSLCAKILKNLGMRLSDTLQRPNEMNPEGYFEDQVLVNANRQLIERFSPAAPHVPPRIPREAEAVAPMLATIRAHLRKHVLDEPGIWGFKDPRTALLLPTYRLIFQGMGIVPSFVFCARDGSTVVESLLQATRLSRDAAEQVYLTRCLTALRDCAANCHVLHYERLIADPVAQIDALARFVWPEGDPPRPLDDAAKRGLVDPRLDRSSLKAQPLTNPLARRMDALIARIEGHDFDRAPVLAELREMGLIHDGYLTWVAQMIDHNAAQGVVGTRSDKAVGADAGNTLLVGMGTSMTALLTDNARLRTARAEAEDRMEALEHRLAATLEAEQQRASQAAAETEAGQRASEDRAASLREAGEALSRQLGETQAELARLREEHEIAVDRARQRLATIAQLEKDNARLKRQAAQDDAKPAAKAAPGTAATAGTQAAAPPSSDELRKSRQANAQLRQRIAKLETAIAQEGETRQAADAAGGTAAVDSPAAEDLRKARQTHAQLRQNIVNLTTAVAQEQDRRKAAEATIVKMENSVRHRAGTALVEAVSRPGWRTIVLPWRLARIGTTRPRPDMDDAEKRS